MHKLNFELKKIVSPVHIIEPFEMRFENGEELVEHGFEKCYLVKSIEAIGGEIRVVLEENTKVHQLDWAKGDAVSFF